jgi:hypothetical protein
MNIFYLDYDVKKCSEYHVDSHVVKMPLETAQLLCSVHWLIGNKAPYKLTHKNHPSSIWTRESKSNYFWLCDLGISICDEYTHRYGRVHASKQVITWCKDNIPDSLPNLDFSEPTPAMGQEYLIENDSLKSYRNYYREGKKHLHFWKKRNIPDWILK